MYIVAAILAFGILIAVHELGHFLVAKACGVKVNEFSVGMGPAILKKQRGETLYSLRCLPIGGYCAMEGEDADTGDARAFTVQPAWKKALILVAGAAMNFLLGLLVVIILYAGAQGFVGTKVVSTADGFKYGGESGLEAGDVIYSINGARTYYSSDFLNYMDRYGGDSGVKMVVVRGGQKVTLGNYQLQPAYYTDSDGNQVYRYGVNFNFIEPTVGAKLKYSFYTSWNFVRVVWMGLSDLVTGAAGVKDLSGVVGIVTTINQVGEQSATKADAWANIAYLCAFIAVNLAVMNLLPIPALDGGRLFFVVVDWIISLFVHHAVNPKYEAYVHAAGLVVLLGFMAYVMYNDIARLIR